MNKRNDAPNTSPPMGLYTAWLSGRLARGRKERFTERAVTINAALASEFLTHNVRNRRLRERDVAKWAKAIKEGRWRYTHQGFAFDKAGALLDGQHRCNAIIRSGTGAIRTDITFGAEPEEFDLIDVGAVRSVADFIHLDGLDYAKLRGAVAAFYLRLQLREKCSDKSVIHAKAIALQSPQFDEAIKKATQTNGVLRPTSAAVAYYEISQNSSFRDRLDDFWRRLVTGADCPEKSPILKLRNALVPIGGRRTQLSAASQDSAVKEAAAIISAWNCWVTGRGKLVLDWPHVFELPAIK